MSESEFSFLSSIPMKTHFFFLCSIILSHPLYFSYFIFLSPYLLKLISFLSPLFITTSLLLLAFLTAVSPEVLHHHYQFSEPSEFEVYKIVFECLELKLEENCVSMDDPVDKFCLKANAGAFTLPEISQILAGEKEGPFGELVMKTESMTDPVDKFCLITDSEAKSGEPEMNHIIAGEKEGNPFGELVNKVEEQRQNESSSIKTESNEKGNMVIYPKKEIYNLGRFGSMRKEKEFNPFNKMAKKEKGNEENGEKEESCHMGNDFGSMRKEKEWKRTLACKLYEERNGVEGDEGMDSLWERHENDSMKKGKGKGKAKSRKGKNGGDDDEDDEDEDEDKDEDEDEDEDEEEAIDGSLCCLQALKFSTGKMNMGMGMGKPNFVKISKAWKGIGWLHNVGKIGKKSFH